MRRAVSLVLVLLLALRVLLGDAMAMGVTPALPAQATPAMADMVHAADGDGHGAHDSAMAQHCCGPTGTDHGQHQAGCTACGACHSALGIPVWTGAIPGPLDGAPLLQRGARFASALATLAIKPPIA